jgi:hypothetical protein
MKPFDKKDNSSAASFGTNDVRSTSQACSDSKKDTISEDSKKHWIEIELIDEENEPVPGEEYCITDPDGIERRGFLNSKGFAREDGIENPGNCKITFPKLDKDAWEPA